MTLPCGSGSGGPVGLVNSAWSNVLLHQALSANLASLAFTCTTTLNGGASTPLIGWQFETFNSSGGTVSSEFLGNLTPGTSVPFTRVPAVGAVNFTLAATPGPNNTASTVSATFAQTCNATSNDVYDQVATLQTSVTTLATSVATLQSAVTSCCNAILAAVKRTIP